MDELKLFAEWFKMMRIQSGYKTQKDLADMSGVSRATISRVEAGLQKPDPDTLTNVSVFMTATTYEELMLKAGYLKDNSQNQEADTPPWATYKDKRDFKKMLEEDEVVMFDGVPISEDDKEKIKRVMEAMFWDAKKKNKRKRIDE